MTIPDFTQFATRLYCNAASRPPAEDGEIGVIAQRTHKRSLSGVNVGGLRRAAS